MTTLEEVIRNNINLPSRPNGRGFFSVLCKVCNDHARKGKRAGFKFEGETVGYNCFNCNHTAGYDPQKHRASMPKPMVQVLDAFGISSAEWEQVTFDAFMADLPSGTKQKIDHEVITINPKELEFPSTFYKLTDDINDEWAQYAIEYLRDTRKFDWTSYPFYLSERTSHPILKKWYGRLIIPVYKDGKLIFWQGRDLTGTMIKKYLSVDEPKDNVLYGFDRLFEYTDEPLYVMEGFFDAHMLHGVATFGNKLTAPQIKWLNRSSRPKVFIPDKFGDGHVAAFQAIAEGWSVSLPDWGSDIKDVNDSHKKYGELFTKLAIKRGTCSGFDAEMQTRLYCGVP